MTTVSRYVLKEHIGPFLLGFALIVAVLLMDVILQTMDQVLSKGVAPRLASELLFFNLAWIVALAVPMAVLIAVLMAFTRLAGDSEIMAAKACGIGFTRLLRPVLAAAALLTILMVLFNDRVLPDWNHRARNLSASLQRRKAALSLKRMEGVVIRNLGPYFLLVRHVDTENDLLQGILIYDTRDPFPSTLYAPAGKIELLGEGSYMRLSLYHGEVLRFDADAPERYLRVAFSRQVLHIHDPDRAFRPRDSSYRSDREMNISTMLGAIRQRRRQCRTGSSRIDSVVDDFLHQVDTAMQTGVTGDLDQQMRTVRARIIRQQRLDETRRKRIDQLLVEVHKKFSIPAACLVFVLVGAPLGTAIRRRGVAVSVGISLVFFWIYWMFLIGGEELADRGYVGPALSMWAPNLFFGLLGAYLVRRTAQDRPWFPTLSRSRTP